MEFPSQKDPLTQKIFYFGTLHPLINTDSEIVAVKISSERRRIRVLDRGQERILEKESENELIAKRSS